MKSWLGEQDRSQNILEQRESPGQAGSRGDLESSPGKRSLTENTKCQLTVRRCGYRDTSIGKIKIWEITSKCLIQQGSSVHSDTLVFTFRFSTGREWCEYSVSIMGVGWVCFLKEEPILSASFPARWQKCSSFKSKLFNMHVSWGFADPRDFAPQLLLTGCQSWLARRSCRPEPYGFLQTDKEGLE